MICGIGVDIVDIQRIQSAWERHGERFLQKIFTQEEIDYCQKRHDASTCLSARFAAKEATMKALGTGLSQGIRFKDIQVSKTREGSPEILLCGNARIIAQKKGVSRIFLSISHDGNCAVACVVMENL